MDTKGVLKNDTLGALNCTLFSRLATWPQSVRFMSTLSPTKRVAIYARVSTDDKGQDPENQLRQLRAWCERMGYAVAGDPMTSCIRRAIASNRCRRRRPHDPG
jgi:Resolvase, N terminal domain